MNDIINIYCDESCHLENDNEQVMGLGAVCCPTKYSKQINHELKWLKKQYGMPDGYELKWTKVGIGKIEYYTAVIEYFEANPYLRFRGYIVPNKKVIDHSVVPGQTHDEWYYKMYYGLLKPLVEGITDKYRIYIDIKDTNGYQKVQNLKSILCKGVGDACEERIERIQEVRSDEVELLQLADFILGAIVFANRDVHESKAKNRVVDELREQTGYSLGGSTSYNSHKINLWFWDGKRR